MQGRVEARGVVASGQVHQGHRCHTGARHEVLRYAPWDRPVAGAAHTAPPDEETGACQGESDRHPPRTHVAGGAGVHEPVQTDTDPEEPAEHQEAGEQAGAGRDGADPAVAVGGHRGGQGQGAVKGVLQYGDDDAAQGTHTLLSARA